MQYSTPRDEAFEKKLIRTLTPRPLYQTPTSIYIYIYSGNKSINRSHGGNHGEFYAEVD